MNFKTYLKLVEEISTPLGTYSPQPVIGAVPSVWSGSIADSPDMRQGGINGNDPANRDVDLGLPKVTKTGIISHINTKTNPIFIHLSDGTRLYMPYDAFRKIKNEPAPGKTMVIVLQRHSSDNSINPSQIQSIKVY